MDSCNLSCLNCKRIYRAPENRPANVMPIGLFTRILDRAQEIGFRRIACYNWTEPFLHPDLPVFASEIAERGLEFMLSSNLSLPKISGLIPALRHCNDLRVTVSGFTQATHERNHSGGDISVVKKHLEDIASALRAGEISPRVVVKYLDFEYNHAEAVLFREYAENLGLAFALIHGVLYKPYKQDYDAAVRDEFVRHADDYPELRKSAIMDACVYRDTSMTLDFRGDAYLCCTCLSTPFFRIGNFLADDWGLLQTLRQTHPFCAVCGTEWAME